MPTSAADTTSRGPATTVVVVTWRGADHITGCLDGLAAQERPHRTLVVDNASDDGTAALLARHPSKPHVLRLPRNAGYAGGIAAALRHVTTPLMAWLNDDAVPAPGWLGTLEDTLLADPRLGAVGSLLRHTGGGVASAGVRLTADGHGADLTAPGRAFGFCGGAVLLRTDVLRSIGGVPSGFFCYYEDTDTAWRLRLAGHDIAIAHDAVVVHRQGASSRPGSPAFHRWNERNRLLMLLRCAPARVAAEQLTRFAALTAVLPLRRVLAWRDGGTAVPRAANFRVSSRCRVLAEVALRLPSTLRQRAEVRRRSVAGRGDVWLRWAGQ